MFKMQEFYFFFFSAAADEPILNLDLVSVWAYQHHDTKYIFFFSFMAICIHFPKGSIQSVQISVDMTFLLLLFLAVSFTIAAGFQTSQRFHVCGIQRNLKINQLTTVFAGKNDENNKRKIVKYDNVGGESPWCSSLRPF